MHPSDQWTGEHPNHYYLKFIKIIKNLEQEDFTITKKKEEDFLSLFLK